MNLTLMQVAALAATLDAARESGVTAALAEHPRSIDDLVHHCGVDAEACARFLDVLEAFALVTREGDRYVAGDELKAQARLPVLGQLDHEIWRHARVFLKSGAPLIAMDAAPAEREGIYRTVVGELGTVFSVAADDLAGRCGLTPASILEFGSGSGVWSLALARRLPSARVTGLDLPAVLEQFRARASSLGLGDRVDTIAGDMHTVSIPEGQWDLAIIANVLRLEPAERARALIGRAVRALKRGGHLLIVDALASGSEAADRARTLYALHLAIRTRSSRVHSAVEVRHWMEAAGCEHPHDITLDSRSVSFGALGALVGRKRQDS